MPIVQFSIPVANVATLLGLGFTKIEIWHSGDGGATFQEITSSAAAAAVLPSSPANNTFQMGGHEIQLSINGNPPVTITFDSLLQQWTPTQVVNQINTVYGSTIASLDGTGKIVLITAPTTGRVSSVQVVYNDAGDLGWVAGQIVYGTDARITLVGGGSPQLLYNYADVAGQLTDLYEWRFSANGVNPISPFSLPISGSTPPIANNVAFATAVFEDMNGNPAQRSVVIVADPTPVSLNNFTVGSELPLIFTADATGFLQIPLVVGMKVRAAIEGTAFVREFVVPGPALTSFDLLAVMGAAPDQFTVQTTPPFLTRRNI